MKFPPLYLLSLCLCACTQNPKHIPPKGVVNPYFDQAYAYLDNDNRDSSFLYFEKAKDLFLAHGDSLGVAKCLVNMAIPQYEQSDYFGAQETALQALDYLDSENSSHRVYLSTNYNILGTSSYELRDFKKSIDFFEKAIAFSDDQQTKFIYRNNIALSLKDLKSYDQSFSLFEELLREVYDEPKTYARILSNYAKSKWEKDSEYFALPELHKALNIRIKGKDLWGLNASYAHLSDYYSTTVSDSALHYARLQYDVARKLASADDQVKALRRLIKIHPVDSTKHYFSSYELLTDSLQQARSAAKNQFALIRYESEKNKADILRLEKENAEKARRILLQGVTTAGILLVLFGGLIVAINYFRRRHRRLELEAKDKIRVNQLKTSRKIHDVVANGIYRVMVEIEHRKNIDREGILDRLEDMYYKSRDISYEAEGNKASVIPFHEQLMELLKSFATIDCKVLIVGNEASVWEFIPLEVQSQVSHILQELMVNMKKHAEADHVVVRFERTVSALCIYYQDSGVGFPTDILYGKGLTSAENRIKSINGSIIFVTKSGKGLKVDMTIPLQ